MGRTRPAAAGGSTVSAAEQLAALEAELAAAGPLDHTDEASVLAYAAIEERMDPLRTAVKAEAEAERAEALAEQERANYRLAGHDFEADPDGPPDSIPAFMPAATEKPVTSEEGADRG